MEQDKAKVVAFLGPIASYTHQATTQRFPEPQYKIIPQTSIEDVFAAVQSGKASHGVVPFENSSNGSVVFTLDLFADTAGRYPDILVCGEIYLPVHHCLLGHSSPASSSSANGEARGETSPKSDLPLRNMKLPSDSPNQSGTVTPTQAAPDPQRPRVKPVHDIKHIKKLYSHPQAWGQCKLFLSTYLKQAERQDVSSTSKAAEHVAKDTSGESAAISSKIAAELNGLDVLAEGIEDVEGNSTRFFVLRRKQDVLASTTSANGAVKAKAVDDSADASKHERPDEGKGASWKTLVSFTLNHGAPGSLADCLAVFRQQGLNLTSINTRPSGEAPWHYIFFVEFMGRKLGDGEGGSVNEALEKLTKVASGWRWLGSWESALGKD